MSSTEQKEVCFFVDLDSMQPTLEFFEYSGLDSSQDTTGIFDAMSAAF